MTPRAIASRVENGQLVVSLDDGTEVSNTLTKRLAHATPEQLANVEVVGRGEGLRWPDLDEDLSVAGLLASGDRPVR